MHQPASGIVDIDEQRTLRTAVLEPPMLGAVDLHQLTQTITPRSRLMDALQPVLSANPKAGLHHPVPQRLDADIQAVNLGQLLGRQARTKIGIALAHDSQDRRAEHCTQSPVAADQSADRHYTRPLRSCRLDSTLRTSWRRLRAKHSGLGFLARRRSPTKRIRRSQN